MVYKKYIKRGGKVFGPYYYSSKRIDGKVVSQYIGDKSHIDSDSEKNGHYKFLIICLAFLFLLTSFFIALQFYSAPTGNAIIQSSSSYALGETVDGRMQISLQAGELLPQNTQVEVSLGGQKKVFPLSQLLTESKTSGNFYIKGRELTGNGRGYGVEGTKENYPEITFSLRITQGGSTGGSENGNNSGGTEENLSNNTSEGVGLPNETPSETLNETPTETPAENTNEASTSTETLTETPVDTSESGDNIGNSGVTGSVILEQEKIVYGKVSKDKPFSYSLEAGEHAELIDGSVKMNGEPIDYTVFAIEEQDNVIKVETDYEETQTGFGGDYLGNTSVDYSIPLEVFNMSAEQGNLDVKLIYNNVSLIEESSAVRVSGEAEGTVGGEGGNTTNETEISLNQTGLALIKSISNITIVKNGNYSISLSEFFANAESYSAKIGSNISVFIKDETALIVPDENYTGDSSVAITAKRDNESITQEFSVSIAEQKITIETKKVGRVKLGEPVKWKATVQLEQADNVTIKVPEEADNITVSKVEDGKMQEITDKSSVTGGIIEASPITGNLILKIEVKKPGLLTRLWRSIVGKITGKAVEGEDNANNLTENNTKDLVINDSATQYEIEYETPAPYAVENVVNENQKEITIVGPDTIHYDNILAYTDLSKETEADKIHLYWINDSDNKKEEVSVDKYDLNNNGLVDYIEWNVPHLSNESYELIIEISKAEHLDENRSFIKDVYPFVFAQDNNWTSIPSGDYLRVGFEKNLTNENDITVYARGTGIIEVYKMNDNSKIMDIPINGENLYKQILTNMSGEEDSFDLLSVGNIDYDYVVDPTVAYAPNNTGNNAWMKALISLSSINSINTAYSSAQLKEISKENGSYVSQATGAGADCSAKTSIADCSSLSMGDCGNYYETSDNLFCGWEGICTGEGGCGSSAYQRILFHVGETNINNVSIRVASRGSAGAVIQMGVWNFTSSKLISLQTQQCYTGSNNPCNFTGVIAPSSNLINSSGDFYAVINTTYAGGNNLDIDYATITVDYNSTADTTPPYFTGIPNSLSIYQNTSVAIGFNATDAVGLSCFAVNDTTNFAINCSGWLSNKTYLTVGTYVLNITINDTSNNLNSTKYSVQVNTTPDTTPPYFTYIANVSIYNNDSVGIKFNATDAVGLSCFAVNDTTNFAINCSGWLSNKTGLTVGSYNLNITINDTSNNLNSSIMRVTVSALPDTTAPSVTFGSVTTNDGATITYNSTVVNVSSSDNSGYHSVALDWNKTLVAWWRFNSNTLANDSSTYGNNGTVSGATWTSSGKLGGAYTFNGVNNGIVYATSIFNNQANTNWSVSAWFKSNSTATQVIWGEIAGAYGLQVCPNIYLTSGKLEVQNYNGGTHLTTTTGTYIDNNWHNVVLARNSTYNYNIYVDGSLAKAGTYQDTNTQYTCDKRSIGYDGMPSGSYWFNGSIDDVQIYNGTLSTSEILAIYNASVNQYYKNFTSLGIGNYTYKAYAQDAAGNVNSTATRSVIISVPDTTAPYFTYIANVSIYTNASVGIDFNATDETGFNCFAVNDTTNFAINCSGWLSNKTGLSPGIYNLNITINDTSNNLNSSVIRVNVTSSTIPYSDINLTYPGNNTEIVRGGTGASSEDAVGVVNNSFTMKAKVYDNSTFAGINNSNCSFYFGSNFVGSSITNSSGDCIISYDKSALANGTYKILANYTSATGYTRDVNSSSVSINLTLNQIPNSVSNIRAGNQYMIGDVAVLNFNMTKDGVLYDPTSIRVNVTKSDTAVVSSQNFTGDNVSVNRISRTAVGQYYSTVLVNSTFGSFIRWEIYAWDASGSAIASAIEADKDVIAATGSMNLSVYNSSGSQNFTYQLYDKSNYLAGNDTSNTSSARAVALGDKYAKLSIKSSQASLDIYGLNISGNVSIIPEIISNYSYYIPPSVSSLSKIVALNDTNFAFDNTTITISKEGLYITKICHCTNWDFANYNCTSAASWVCNASSVYNMQENSTDFWFNVSSFTGYAGGAGFNDNLTIYDSNDSEGGNNTVFTGQQVQFYAKYINSTSGNPINATCNFSENSSGSWSSPVNMNYNSTSSLYRYNKTFSSAVVASWNVSCYGNASYTALSAIDTLPIIVPPAIGLSVITPSSSGISSGVNASQYYLFNVSVNVSCSGGDCGDVNISLDPTSNYAPNNTGNNAWVKAIVRFANLTDINTAYSAAQLKEISKENGSYVSQAESVGADCSGRTATADCTTGGYNSGNCGNYYQPSNNYQCFWDGACDAVSPCGTSAFQRILFHIGETSVNNVSVRVASRGSDGAVIQMGVWNFTSSRLIPLQSQNCYPGSNQPCNFTGVIAPSSNLINSSGDFYVVMNVTGTGNLDIDYATITIDYNASAGKGLINTTIGATPFYTNDSNPRTINLNNSQSQIVTFYVNATGSVGDNYAFFVFANKTSYQSVSNITGSWNVTIQTPDTTYPIFSGYYDNNASLTGSGTALFNVTVTSTNGTVWLSINGSTFYATNLSNVYTVSVTMANGSYTYNWSAYGNGTSHNLNYSSNMDYTVNASKNLEAWPKFQYDLNNTGFASNNTAPDNIGTAVATFYPQNIGYGYLYSLLFSPPVVANGYVYVGSKYWLNEMPALHEERVWQLNASNISQIISSYVPYNFSGAGDTSVHPPVVANGFVYTGSNNYLYQLNASNIGQVIAKYNMGSYYSPAVTNDYVYIGGSANKVYQLNASNVSQLIYSYTASGSVSSWSYSPAVANGYVYIVGKSQNSSGSWINTFYQLNANDISQLSSSYITDSNLYSIVSSPAVANGYVYIGSNNYTVYQRNASDISQIISSYHTVGGDIIASPAVANGYVYIGSNDYNFYQLNASNISKVISSYPIWIGSSSPAVANGYVYIGNAADNKVYQLNASNISQIISSYTTAGSVSASAVANGYVYISGGDKVYQLAGPSTDTTPPLINFTNPTNASGITVSKNYILVNVTASDANLAYIAIRLYNSSGGLVNETTSSTSPFFLNLTGFDYGLYFFNATAYDSSDNKNYTETRNVTLVTGRIGLDLITPSSAQVASGVNVSKGAFFNVSVNVSCYQNDCEDINVSLDPSLTRTYLPNSTGSSATRGTTVKLSISDFNLTDFTGATYSSSELTNISKEGDNAVSISSSSGVDCSALTYTPECGDINDSGTCDSSYEASSNTVCYWALGEPNYCGGGSGAPCQRPAGHQFKININENAAGISNISMRIVSQGDAAYQPNITLAAWNFSSSKFVVFNASLCLTGDGPPTAVMCNITGVINDSSNFVSGGYMYLDVFSNANAPGSIPVYYGEVVVNSIGKGLISSTIGNFPFYTNESNPRTITLSENQSQIVTFFVNATGNAGNMYEFFAYANRTADLRVSNVTGSWNVTIQNPSDTIPQITVDSPLNQTYILTTSLFNISSNAALSYCKMTLDNWNTNYSMTLNASSTGAGYINSTMSQGSHTVKFWCNDTSNNINATESRTFFTDSIAPIITVVAPQNTTYSTTTLIFNVNLNEDGDSCKYRLDRYNSTSETWSNGLWTTMTKNNNTNFGAVKSSGWLNSSYGLKFNCSDVAGNFNATDYLVYFAIDTSSGGGGGGQGGEYNLSITYPESITYTSQVTEMNFSASGLIDSCWYSLTNGTSNTTVSCTAGTVTGITSSEGSNTWRVFVNDTAGNNGEASVTFVVDSNPPNIAYVSPISAVDLAEATSKSVNFTAIMYDADGVNDLNDTSVSANFSKSGETLRANSSCIWKNDIDGNSANYSCTIGLWYWDGSGNWNVSVEGKDLSGFAGVNISTNFTVHLLQAIVTSPYEVGFGSVSIGGINQTALASTIINNTGNDNLSGKIAIQAINLIGDSIPSNYIDARNITVSAISGQECEGVRLQNGTDKTVNTTVLDKGNLSASQAQARFYYCFPQIPANIPSQTYSTKNGGSWFIKIV